MVKWDIGGKLPLNAYYMEPRNDKWDIGRKLPPNAYYMEPRNDKFVI
jgi:hypothetical protein